MDMEQRKVNWANRVHSILLEMDGMDLDPVNPAYIRRLTSICQDAFNEGHKAGEQHAENKFIKAMSGEPE